MASASNAGQKAMNTTRRNVPSHLPTTMLRVESDVAARMSRLPRCRSSAIEVGAIADIINKPKMIWRM